jgi:TetR/AcrR family transcriptional repressor of multidrug resistance operon
MNVQLDTLAEKKRAIFQSTLELIRHNGFHGTPMSMIAKNAGVAAGTIYHYFESKDELMIELFYHIKDQTSIAMYKDDDETLPFQERFFKLWINLWNHMIANPANMTFMEQFTSSPYNTEEPGKEMEKYTKRICDFFKSGIENGYLKKINSRLMGPVFHGSVMATAKAHIAKRHHFTTTELHDVAQIIWDGIKL